MRRVLVVDDDLDLREALADLLREAGWEVVCAENGLEALLLLGGAPVDVILLDYMMPVMNGREFRAAQLARPDLAAIPVVLASAALARPEAGSLAPAAVLPKPFTPAALLSCLDGVAIAR